VLFGVRPWWRLNARTCGRVPRRLSWLPRRVGAALTGSRLCLPMQSRIVNCRTGIGNHGDCCCLQTGQDAAAPSPFNMTRSRVPRPFASVACAAAATAAARAQDLDRLKYNDPKLTVDLGVGLYAFPIPFDDDHDGDLDLDFEMSETRVLATSKGMIPVRPWSIGMATRLLISLWAPRTGSSTIFAIRAHDEGIATNRLACRQW
jgi:hypothetical protein